MVLRNLSSDERKTASKRTLSGRENEYNPAGLIVKGHQTKEWGKCASG